MGFLCCLHTIEKQGEGKGKIARPLRFLKKKSIQEKNEATHSDKDLSERKGSKIIDSHFSGNYSTGEKVS